MTRQRNHGGFTLVEALVTISVVATLVVIVIPSLRTARESALRIEAMTSARESSSTIFLYAIDQSDRVPALAPESDQPDSFLRIRFRTNEWVAVRYFSQSSFWHAVMMSRGSEFMTCWFSPSVIADRDAARDPRWWRPADYLLSHSFLADSKFWVRGQSQRPQDRRPMMLSETAHPSAKCLLMESRQAVRERVTGADFESTPVAVSVADGSAACWLLQDATSPVPNTHFGGSAQKFLMTENGVLGRDHR